MEVASSDEEDEEGEHIPGIVHAQDDTQVQVTDICRSLLCLYDYNWNCSRRPFLNKSLKLH